MDMIKSTLKINSMSNYLKIKEHQINFVDNLPYELGSIFDENNIDLELKKNMMILEYIAVILKGDNPHLLILPWGCCWE